ncbi:MAG: hypothetical protein EBX47_07430 [Synechococcaceae bacterium WB8_1B_057]|nr:hypothetical protein [Synechococcaceae bacterium WB6_1A_059]NDG79247.1 hypothetical protein [Synechococcaceae bacterium WB8_1B_057]
MDYFYDGQLRRYVAQFINIMSNFAYKDNKGNLVQVPVRYGDLTKQVAQVLRKNSENAIPSAPFIACYIKDLQFDRPRLQDPTFVSKINIRERDVDQNNDYLNTQGSNYTIERIMPSPYLLTLTADIWTSNTDQKWQIWEQIVVFFNPSLEIQTTDNYIDWTSLSVLHLENQTYTSRTIPQGVAEDIDILTMNFTAPIWITPPAKVRKLGVITKIISNVFSSNAEGIIQTQYRIDGASDIFNNITSGEEIVITQGDFDLLILNNQARLVPPSVPDRSIDITDPRNSVSWQKLLSFYPGKFVAGVSQLRFSNQEGSEIIAYVSLDPLDDKNMVLNINQDTIPTNTIIAGRGTIDAIINPSTYKPTGLVAGLRFLILEGINDNDQFGTLGYQGPIAWKNADNSDFHANANDIIEYNGSNWLVVFDSKGFNGTIYTTNSYTGTQYQYSNGDWSKTYEGIYNNKLWRLIL